MADQLCDNCAFRKPRFDQQGRERLAGICCNIFSDHVNDIVWPFHSCGHHSSFFDMTLDSAHFVDHPYRT